MVDPEHEEDVASAEDDVASAEPDKRLFIEMLTRDIELIPAILDLWDNSIDGAMRRLNGRKSAPGTSPLEGNKITIAIDGSQFAITDNCGGIPLEVAKNYAFRFGRARLLPP